MSDLNNFGIRISRNGFDVKDTSDFQTILNSSWPVLKVHFAGPVTFTTDGTNNVAIYTHSLGYAPVFQVFSEITHSLDTGDGTRYDSAFTYGCSTSTIYANLAAGTYTVYWYVFRQNLQTSFTAPNIDTVARVAGNFGTDFGLKVAKAGKAITSTDLRDYVIHSGTQELGVAQVATTSLVAPATTWTITHNLGYNPAWLFYQAGTAANTFEAYNLVRATANNNSITFTGAQSALSGTYATVIFKDPVLAV